MTSQISCPRPECWIAHLDNKLSVDERAQLLAHLNVCSACRQTLEELASGRATLGELRPIQPPPQVGSETLAETTPTDDLTLPFLTPSDQPGQLGKLGHYAILEVIGRGGMGVVLKALDERLQRTVAVKVMAPQLAASTTARKRFLREGRAQALISHENVVIIHAVEETNGLPSIVMQFVGGGSLQDRLDKGPPLSVEEILRIGLQVAQGLAAAHDQGLIHRDVKPANILLASGGREPPVAESLAGSLTGSLTGGSRPPLAGVVVKITDFGLARAADDATLSKSGVIAGTPQYMAPEQAQGEELDPRADLFSFGSVLYTLCTGQPPFRAGNAMAILKKVCDETPKPIRELNSAIPEWLCAIVEKLHAKNKDDRFASAVEVAHLLEQHAAHLKEPSRTPVPPKVKTKPTLKPAPKGRSWWMVGVGLGLPVALLLGLLAYRNYGPPGEIHLNVKDMGLLILVDGPGDMQRWETSHTDVLTKAKPGQYTLRVILNNQVVHVHSFVLAPKEIKEITLPRFLPPAQWSAEQVIGEPNVAIPGSDNGQAWASATQDEQDEWLVLTYAQPVKAFQVLVHETFCPGALVKVTVFREDGTEVEVWTGQDPTTPDMPHGISKVPFRVVDFKVQRIKLYLDSKKVPGWNEIDAVGLMDDIGKIHWVQHAEASSTYADH